MNDGRTTYEALERRVRELEARLKESESGHKLEIAERKRRENELNRLNCAHAVINECNRILVNAAEDKEFLPDICRVLVETGGHRLAWVGFADRDDSRTVRPVGSAGYEAGYLDTLNVTWADTERGRGPTGTAIRTGRPVVMRDIATSPDYAPWRAEAMARGYASSIAIPLVDKEEVFGALNIYATEKDALDTNEVHLLVEMTNDLAYGISILRLRASHEQVNGALRRERDLVSRIAETSPAGIVVLDIEGNIVYANAQAEEALSLSKSNITQRTYNAPQWHITDHHGHPFPDEELPFRKSGIRRSSSEARGRRA